MRIDEAIEIEETYLKGEEAVDHFEHFIAEKLALEALKRVRDYKKAHIGLHYTPMPGETEE